MKTQWLLTILVLSAAPAAQAAGLAGEMTAIETRPIWDRPAMGLTLQQETEIVFDRGNGRIVDAATYSLRETALAQNWHNLDSRQRFESFQAQLDRARQNERAAARQANQMQRKVIVEIESERLKADRERWMKSLAKPRHAEAAIVDRQTAEKK